MTEILLLLATGVAIGLLGGLLGIGGGVVAVPVLLEVMAGRADATATAIGTAHAAVLLSALPAAAAHARAGTVNGKLLRAWLPALLAGAVLGLVLGRIVPPTLLVGGFALVAGALALRMLVGEGVVLASAPPAPPLGWLPPLLVGGSAAAFGVGAGTLSGPVLALLSVPLHAAIGAGSVFNIVVALPAMLVFALAGQVAPVPALLLAAPAFVVAPWAARLSGRLPTAPLRRAFGLVLLAITLRLAWRLATGS